MFVWITRMWLNIVVCGASTMQVMVTSLKNATGLVSTLKMVHSGE